MSARCTTRYSFRGYIPIINNPYFDFLTDRLYKRRQYVNTNVKATTHHRARRATGFRCKDFEGDWSIIPSPKKYLPAVVNSRYMRSNKCELWAAHKPPEPIFGPNSTSYDVIIQFFNSTRIPLVEVRYCKTCRKNSRSRSPSECCISRRCSDTVIAMTLLPGISMQHRVSWTLPSYSSAKLTQSVLQLLVVGFKLQ
jgi:hypothetical protein